MIYKTRHLYAHYLTLYPDSPVTRAQFEKVLRLFFGGIVLQILEGFVFELGYYLASIRIQKVQRTYTKPRMNLSATRKLWAEHPEYKEQDIKVYYTDQPYWYRFYWAKKDCVVANKSVYRFDPTKGPKGNSRKLSRKLQTEPFAHLNYYYDTPTDFQQGSNS